MERSDNEINNEINNFVQNFFKSNTIAQAQEVLNLIIGKLRELEKYYAGINRKDLEKLTTARLNVWEAYDIYINAKKELLKANITDERGQFMIAFSKGSIIIQSKKTRGIIRPDDILNRIKLASEFMKITRLIQEVPEITYNSTKQIYKLVKESDDKGFIINADLLLKNWVRLLIQWKLEILSLGVIISVLKGEWSNFKAMVNKHLELSSQLDALFEGQKYQKIRIMDDQMYKEFKNIVSSRYYDLTSRKGGFFRGGGTSDILIFINRAEPIQDIVVPSFIDNLTFKELFPKELEKET
jgi:hypothetical protein